MSECSKIGRWKEYLDVVFRRRQRVVDTNISDFGSVRKKFSNELSLRAGCLDAFGEGLRCYPL